MSIFSKIFGLVLSANPANPSSGRRVLFAKSDGWYDKNSSGTTTKLATMDDVGGGASYLVYTALLTQTGTNAPVATVLENTLGGTVVWTRDDVGTYYGTLSGVFTENKTWGSPYAKTPVDQFKLYWVSVNSVSLLTYGFDNQLDNTPVEIRVYP
jgi:hypothetical protein